MDINEITSKIIKAAMTIHNELGPGLLESVYQECLRIELEDMNLHVQKEVLVPVMYKGREITQDGFRIDLLVEDAVVVELKSVEEVKPVYKKQLLTYLRLTGKTVGLLINFNANLLKEGIIRVVNKFEPAPQEINNSLISRRAAEFAEKDEFCPHSMPFRGRSKFLRNIPSQFTPCNAFATLFHRGVLCVSNDRREWARDKYLVFSP